jgi:hypothetical protein
MRAFKNPTDDVRGQTMSAAAGNGGTKSLVITIFSIFSENTETKGNCTR